MFGWIFRDSGNYSKSSIFWPKSEVFCIHISIFLCFNPTGYCVLVGCLLHRPHETTVSQKRLLGGKIKNNFKLLVLFHLLSWIGQNLPHGELIAGFSREGWGMRVVYVPRLGLMQCLIWLLFCEPYENSVEVLFFFLHLP